MGKDKWHNRLHLVALENGIIGHFCSIMWKSLVYSYLLSKCASTFPGLPCVTIIGELNNAASMKLDLEGWFPGSGAYRELLSCSNCTDYQSGACRSDSDKQRRQLDRYKVHTLYNTINLYTTMYLSS